MKNKRKLLRLLAALLALLVLTGCGAETAPAETSESEPAEDAAPVQEPVSPEVTEAPLPETDGVVKVATVDEFLAAIAPNTTIELAAGEYDLSTASNYGRTPRNGYYRWNPDPSGDEGYELEIRGVDGLTIRGAGREETTISAVPRFVNVLRFVGCNNLTLQDLTAGHTREQGLCSGGVVDLQGCSNVTVDGCGLFGCGTVGVWATDCNVLTVTGTHIYECSSSAVDASSCRNVLVKDCPIYRNGTKQDWNAYSIFNVNSSDGFVVTGCEIYDNDSYLLVNSNLSENVMLLSSRVKNNQLSYAFGCYQFPIMVDGCSFEQDTESFSWYTGDSLLVLDRNGDMLDDAAFENMSLQELDPDTLSFPALPAAAEVPAGGEITVTTADEFLNAIGPNRTIVLDGKTFDLSTASGYGSLGGEYYYWSETYDGSELVITGVSGLTIKAKDPDPAATSLTAVPRYANVLNFRSCENLNLVGFTAGHSKGAGECTGGVFNFEGCNNVTVDSCRLYGCGTYGVLSWNCSGLKLKFCEIYSCTFGGAYLSETSGIRFVSCNIHDVPSPALSLFNYSDAEWDGDALSEAYYDVDQDGKLCVWSYDPYYYTQEDVEPVAESVSVFYQSQAVSELYLPLNDSVILTADGYFSQGDGSRAKYTWTSEDTSVLQIRSGRDSHQCMVKLLSAPENGVLLTLDCGGVQTQVRIFAWEG